MPDQPRELEPPKPRVYEAELDAGPSGRVLCGGIIDFATAVARRLQGEDVVVCGEDLEANRRLAREIESAVGEWERGSPHIRRAGPGALPHFQQTRRTPPAPRGHTFYETERRKARKKT